MVSQYGCKQAFLVLSHDLAGIGVLILAADEAHIPLLHIFGKLHLQPPVRCVVASVGSGRQDIQVNWLPCAKIHQVARACCRSGCACSGSPLCSGGKRS